VNIGIIGSGNMGSGLGKIWATKGHSVVFSFSRDPRKLEALAASLPNSKAGTPVEAVENSQIVLLSVGWSSVRDALKAAGPLKGKILIDCTNPITPGGDGLDVGLTTSGSEEIAGLVPDARVIKAFNTAFAEIYRSASRLFGSRMLSMFYCGDDTPAKHTVARLIAETGLEPLDCGPLRSARYLEPLAMLMIQLGYRQGLGTNMGLNLIRR